MQTLLKPARLNSAPQAKQAYSPAAIAFNKIIRIQADIESPTRSAVDRIIAFCSGLILISIISCPMRRTLSMHCPYVNRNIL